MFRKNNHRLIRTLSKLLADSPPDGARPVEADQLEQLLGVYYRHIAPTDLEEHDPHDLLGALIAHWRLMRRRRPDEAVVRVYNPEQEEHGWRSNDTIVEVVAPDMPFLVDSISAALNRKGMTISLTIHPVFGVSRDSKGVLTAVHESKSDEEATSTEAVLRFHVDRQPAQVFAGLERLVSDVIADITLATSDWLKMRRQAEKIQLDLGSHAPQAACPDADEVRAFLNWMINDHFLFIATCRFAMQGDAEGGVVRLVADSGLGVLRGAAESGQRAEDWVSGLGVDLSVFHYDLLVTKANARSNIHRPAYMDCVAVKQRDGQGKVIGLYCLVGLFSSGAYSTPPRQIPLLRKKIEEVFTAAKITPNSHSGRVVANILDNFPRDLLFQIGTKDLLSTTLGVLSLQERQRTRLFIVQDPFRRFFTCLVYLPREHYSRDVRIAVQNILSEALGGTDVVFDTQFSESILARVYYVIRVPVGSEPSYDIDDLERQVVEVTTTWLDGLRTALFKEVAESRATGLLSDYADGFPGGYREDCHPRIAVKDIQRIELARRDGRLVLHLYHPIAENPDQLHVRLYSLGKPASLSQVIPILGHMGLSVFGERPYRIRHPVGDAWIHDFSTHRPTGRKPVSSRVRSLFGDAFLRVWESEIDDDGFNGLVLRAGLSWKEAMLFRAYSRYEHQIKVPYTQAYTIAVLNRHPEVVRKLNRLFRLHFSPDETDAAEQQEQKLQEFESLLDKVSSLDEDRILRGFLNLIQATLRTNFFCADADGKDKTYLSFKFDPSRIQDVPLPLPMFEIFVFSAHMEGVHLRGGRVARGGLRWSDRMEDYRTEVLGLMKAQMVKNTVIVPVGSKGGFVVKNGVVQDSREQRMEKVVACYQTLLRGMLDVTDNLVGDELVPPPGVVRREGAQQTYVSRQQHAIAKHITRHITDADDGKILRLGIQPKLAKVALDRLPGSPGRDPH